MTEDKSRPTQTLRQTDFLPARFLGDRLDRHESTAHFLTFTDYLDAQDIDTTNARQLPTILKVFKWTLQGQAQIWIDKLTFTDYNDLKDSFIRRFSPAKSLYAHVTEVNTMIKDFQEDLKPEQEEALSKLLDGTSVFASLPTGAGKSRIYGTFPKIKDLVSLFVLSYSIFLSLSHFYNDYDKALLTSTTGKPKPRIDCCK